MPLENLEEEGLPKNPDLRIAQLRFLLSLPEHRGNAAVRDELMAAVRDNSEARRAPSQRPRPGPAPRPGAYGRPPTGSGPDGVPGTKPASQPAGASVGRGCPRGRQPPPEGGLGQNPPGLRSVQVPEKGSRPPVAAAAWAGVGESSFPREEQFEVGPCSPPWQPVALGCVALGCIRLSRTCLGLRVWSGLPFPLLQDLRIRAR